MLVTINTEGYRSSGPAKRQGVDVVGNVTDLMQRFVDDDLAKPIVGEPVTHVRTVNDQDEVEVVDEDRTVSVYLNGILEADFDGDALTAADPSARKALASTLVSVLNI